MRLAHLTVLALFCTGWTALPAGAQGQVVGGIPGMLPGQGFSPFGNSGMMPGMNGFNNQQLGTMMGMRMMQGFGNRGVQTGMADPFVNNGFGSQPALYAEQPGASNSAASGKSKHAGSSSKREEARAKRAEQKRLAAEAKAKPKADKVSKKSRKQNS